MELTYKQNGDYLFPEMELSELDQTPVGKYGLMRQQYLEEERPGLYAKLMLSGKLMEHLHEIEQTAKTRLDEMMTLLKAQNGVTEQMKAENILQFFIKMKASQQNGEVKYKRAIDVWKSDIDFLNKL